MEITADYLKTEIENLRKQHSNASAVAQQASGAIALAESLLLRLEQSPPEVHAIPVQDFARMVGGEGAKAAICDQ